MQGVFRSSYERERVDIILNGGGTEVSEPSDSERHDAVYVDRTNGDTGRGLRRRSAGRHHLSTIRYGEKILLIKKKSHTLFYLYYLCRLSEPNFARFFQSKCQIRKFSNRVDVLNTYHT